VNNRAPVLRSIGNRLLGATVAAAALLALSAGSAAAAAPDYKVIPKLEEMKDRTPAPDFTLSNLEGKKVSLKDYRGKVVFLNFWASWCGPCRSEMPDMDKLYREFKGKGFEIVAVNVKDKQPDAVAFLKQTKVSYPIMLDPAGEVGLLYGAWGMPASYLIDRQGVVLARMWGPAEWYSPQARNLIKTLVELK
jgi:DsbE subfamily thiol:disulfide oxidoreductase